MRKHASPFPFRPTSHLPICDGSIDRRLRRRLRPWYQNDVSSRHGIWDFFTPNNCALRFPGFPVSQGKIWSPRCCGDGASCRFWQSDHTGSPLQSHVETWHPFLPYTSVRCCCIPPIQYQNITFNWKTFGVAGWPGNTPSYIFILLSRFPVWSLWPLALSSLLLNVCPWPPRRTGRVLRTNKPRFWGDMDFPTHNQQSSRKPLSFSKDLTCWGHRKPQSVTCRKYDSSSWILGLYKLHTSQPLPLLLGELLVLLLRRRCKTSSCNCGSCHCTILKICSHAISLYRKNSSSSGKALIIDNNISPTTLLISPPLCCFKERSGEVSEYLSPARLSFVRFHSYWLLFAGKKTQNLETSGILIAPTPAPHHGGPEHWDRCNLPEELRFGDCWLLECMKDRCVWCVLEPNMGTWFFFLR